MGEKRAKRKDARAGGQGRAENVDEASGMGLQWVCVQIHQFLAMPQSIFQTLAMLGAPSPDGGRLAAFSAFLVEVKLNGLGVGIHGVSFPGGANFADSGERKTAYGR